MIYYLIYWLLLFFAILSSFVGKQENKILIVYFYIVASIGLVCFAGFRDHVGYDYFAYESIYDNIHQIGFSIQSNELNIEYGYILLCELINNYSVLIFLTALLSIGLKLIYLYKDGNNIMVSLFMYYCGVFITYDMGVMRQGLATAILLFSIRYILKRNFKKFLFIVIIATLFHVSAFTFIPVYFLNYKEFSRKTYYLYIIIAFIFYISVGSQLLANMINIVPLDIISSKASYYTHFQDIDLMTSVIKRIIVLILFVEIMKRTPILDGDLKQRIYLNGYFLSILFLLVFAKIPIIGGRGNAELYFLQIFVFSKLVNSVNGKLWKGILILIIAALSYYSLIGPLGDIYGGYLPYKTI